MNAQVLPLVCPQCGNACKLDPKLHSFGAQFKCSACGVSSVLVINHQLYLKSGSEHVCVACGRLIRENTNYCQCGEYLFRQCQSCIKEFHKDDLICPTCGWDSVVLINSEKSFFKHFEKFAANALSHSIVDRWNAWYEFKSWIGKVVKQGGLEQDLLQKFGLEVGKIIGIALCTFEHYPFGSSGLPHRGNNYENPGYALRDLGPHQTTLISEFRRIAMLPELPLSGLPFFIELITNFGWSALPLLEYLIFERYTQWKSYDGFQKQFADALKLWDPDRRLDQKVGWLTPRSIKNIVRSSRK